MNDYGKPSEKEEEFFARKELQRRKLEAVAPTNTP